MQETNNEQYSLMHKCKLCGYTKGKHLVGTLACPYDGKPFTHFRKDQFFVAADKAPPKLKFTI